MLEERHHPLPGGFLAFGAGACTALALASGLEDITPAIGDRALQRLAPLTRAPLPELPAEAVEHPRAAGALLHLPELSQQRCAVLQLWWHHIARQLAACERVSRRF